MFKDFPSCNSKNVCFYRQEQTITDIITDRSKEFCQ